MFCLLYIKMAPFDSDFFEDSLKLVIYTDSIPFWSIFMIFYLYLNVLYNKRKLKKLNTEWIEKIDQLQKYADKVKEVSTL